ncbi:hypothetical protein CcCBS67573_g08632 [Chytriomyces confervae]|uniref:C2H2-type domain-containing protein n=1 Tax=Chytriomyces confervae TaxID=246404 RepID=A0A507EHK2_9FUNG|nr:hypothetical protein CcCBS67573_g08632 [Chytriomyces confervae]
MAEQVFVFPAPRSDPRRPSSDTGSPDLLQQQQHQHQQQHHQQEPGHPMRLMKRFSCKFTGCTKDFSTSGHAARHARLHLNYKPFACDQCHMSFYRNDNLTQHKRSHNNPFPSANTSPTLPNLQDNLMKQQQQQQLVYSVVGPWQNQFIQQPSLLDSNAASAAAMESDASSLRDYSPPLSPASKISARKLSKTSVEFLLE